MATVDLREKLEEHDTINGARSALTDQARRLLRFQEDMLGPPARGVIVLELDPMKDVVTVQRGCGAKLTLTHEELGGALLGTLLARVHQVAKGRATDLWRLLESGSDAEICQQANRGREPGDRFYRSRA